jgi:hypothetical protein
MRPHSERTSASSGSQSALIGAGIGLNRRAATATAANKVHRNASDGFAPAESKANPAPQNDPSREALRDCSLSPRYWWRGPFLRGRMGHGMKAQGTKLQATENDLKRLMADVTRAMEKAQEAITRIASNAAVTATETKRAQC